MGREFRIMLVGNKPYCCCAAQHAVIDCTAKIANENVINPEDIIEIIIEQRPREVLSVGNILEPHDVVSAQFSARFGVALRLIKGNNGFQDYNENNIKDPAILALIGKIKYMTDEKCEKLKADGGAIVSAKLKDGTVYRKQTDYAKGTRQNPMTFQELKNKFQSLTAGVIPDKQVKEIMNTVDSLDDLNNINILASLLAAPGK